MSVTNTEVCSFTCDASVITLSLEIKQPWCAEVTANHPASCRPWKNEVLADGTGEWSYSGRTSSDLLLRVLQSDGVFMDVIRDHHHLQEHTSHWLSATVCSIQLVQYFPELHSTIWRSKSSRFNVPLMLITSSIIQPARLFKLISRLHTSVIAGSVTSQNRTHDIKQNKKNPPCSESANSN